MNTLSKNRTPLFVNSSQVQKYGCSPRASTAVVSDDSADQWNIFSRFSTSSGVDAAAKRACKDFSNDDKSHYKPYVSNAVSPVFNKQKQPKPLPFSQNSTTVDGSVRTIRKDSAVAPHVPVDNSSDASSSSKAEDTDSDCTSAVLPVRSRKHRRRRVYQLIDSDSSDSDVQICKTSFSRDSINNELKHKASKHVGVTAERTVQRLSALEHRHCFDPLLNCDSSGVVKNSDIMQSLQRSHDERLQRNNVFRNSVRRFPPSPCETFDGNISEKSDTADDVTIPSVSSKCSVHLQKLQICDVPCRLVLSQEDKLVLSGSGRCSSAGSCQTSVVNNNNFSASGDLVQLCEAGAVQSSDMQYCFSDDLFSDNEQVESVCLSPSHYCNSGEYKDDISKASEKSLESAVTCKQPEVPFVSYSQAEEDCILIDDSDDDLFANLTQNDITIKVEDDEVHQNDDCKACDSGDDDSWMRDDVDCVAAASSRTPVEEMPEMLKMCDPWIDDVADVSSDELQEAYNAAMSRVVPADYRDYRVSPHSPADNQHLRRDNDNVTVVSDADLKLLKQSSVVIEPLRMSNFPQEIHSAQKQKCSYESDAVVVDEDSDDSQFGLSESVRTKSISCELNTDTKYRVGDTALATEVDIYKKPDSVLKSSDLMRYVHCDGLASNETSIRHVKEPDSDAEVVDWDRAKSKCGVFENINKLSSACDTDEVVENVDIKCKYDKKRKRARLALENCVEVAEFYGTSLTKTSKENRRQKRKLTAVSDMMDVDKVADTKNRNTGLFGPEEDKVRPVDNSAYEQEEWKNKSLLQGISKKTSSLQCQKIAQMRDCDKQKLRKNKKHTVSGRQQQVDDSNDRFMGLSQFSVAKQQLVERNRLLKAIGLYCIVFLYHFKIAVKSVVLLRSSRLILRSRSSTQGLF